MTGKSTTSTPDGDLISITTQPPVATISFGRKNGLPGYSNEEFSIFLQVPLDGIDTTDVASIEKMLDPQAGFVKAYVYKQLGVPFSIDGSVVRGEAPAETPKAARKTASSSPSKQRETQRGGGGGASPDDKSEYWAQLAGAEKNGDHWKSQGGETIFDNREGKRNPKAPDFKFADAGVGLWLDRKPDWFGEPGDGEIH